MKKSLRSMTFAAMCLALALVLPFLTGQIPQIGQALSPMHLPALLCGFLCGPVWGFAIGASAPILRYLLFSMPQLPNAVPMAFELASYGLLTGICYRLFPKKIPYLYASLILSMIGGRMIWGIVKWVTAVVNVGTFGFRMFISSTVLSAIPGMICQIVFVPLIVLALKKAKILDD